MNLIIAGSRYFNFYYKNGSFSISFIDEVLEALNIPFPESVICGCGGVDYDEANKRLNNGLIVSDQGIDRLGEIWADSNELITWRYPAKWKKQGRPAGPIRNKEMAKVGDALLLIWDGKSPGSKNMKFEMLKLKKPVYEVILKVHNV